MYTVSCTSNNDRNWTSELEEFLQKVQQEMEMKCDGYFELIKPKTVEVRNACMHVQQLEGIILCHACVLCTYIVQYFFKTYCARASTHLQLYDKFYCEPIKEQEKNALKVCMCKCCIATPWQNATAWAIYLILWFTSNYSQHYLV